VGVGSLPSLDGLRGVLADQWDGYPLQRQRVLDAIADAPAPTVVVTGDIHASAAGPLRSDPADPASPVIGAEFVGTSISSDNGDFGALFDSIFAPAFEYFQSARRGYVRCEFTPAAATATYVVVADATDPDSPTTVDASFELDPDRTFTRLPA
jgi:alkaline phosphatase D